MENEYEFELIEEVTEEDLAPEIEYKYVLGQDPGDTTGVALLRYTDNTPPELIYLHQIPDGREGFFYFFIGSMVGEGTDITSVSERWVKREGVKGAVLTPCYIEGIQDAIWGFQTEYQSPDVKTVIGDEFLKISNLWTEGKRHQMDALLHALYWLRNQGHEPTLKALTGDLGKPLAQPGEADEKTLPQPGGNGGGEEGDSGEGTPSDAGEAFARMVEAAEKAADEIRKAVAAAAELGEGDGEPAGSGNGGGEGGDHGTPPEFELGSKRKRSLNGAFMGFDDDEDE